MRLNKKAAEQLYDELMKKESLINDEDISKMKSLSSYELNGVRHEAKKAKKRIADETSS